jgi:hypothetical protein
MRISQFMGRLAEVNWTDITDGQETDTHDTGVIQFSSILLFSDVHFGSV